MSSLWQSSRLVYRSVENEDESFLETLGMDAEAFMNATPFLPVPQGKKQATALREFLEGKLLNAVSLLLLTLINWGVIFRDATCTTLGAYITAFAFAHAVVEEIVYLSPGPETPSDPNSLLLIQLYR